MKWRVRIAQGALKFLKKEKSLSQDTVFELIEKSIRYFRGEKINIDIGQLRGKWQGFHRIRKGKIRIIAEFDFDNSVVFIKEIDWRGNIYK